MSRKQRGCASRRKGQEMLSICGEAGTEGRVDKALGISFASMAAVEHKTE